MGTPKIAFLFLLTAISSTVWADTAKCVVKIEDVNRRTEYKVEQSFAFNPGSEAQRKHFALPGSAVSCTLAFFDLKTGTMLSCELDELGHHFVQSDRSALKEDLPRNNLSFRFKSSFYVLESSCK